jgi:mannan endo-1,4-beta-mannosidase
MKKALVLALVVVVPLSACRADNSGFVEPNGLELELGGRRYLFVGTNYWYGLNLASSGPGGDRGRLCRELDALRTLGVTNLRIMVGTEGPDSEPWRMVPSLQTDPGVYDPDVLDGLDYLLAEMNERGMRAVACLTNFWHWSGGMAQYVSWNGGGPIPYPPPEPGGDWNVFQDYASDFYSNEEAMQDLRDHIAFLTGRYNPYSSLLYSEDPTIMAWELANEPRGFHNNAAAFNTWLDDTAAYIKSLDPNHLVTTGCEGNTPWPSWNGLDFVANHNGPDIDYATVHIWPQNWEWFDPSDPEATFPTALSAAQAYLSAHLDEAGLLGKPLVLEEFGLARDGGSYDPGASVGWRDSLLASLYASIEASAAGGGAGCGDNVWSWAGEGRPTAPFGGFWSQGDDWTGDPPHEHQGWYSIYDADSTTAAVVAGHADEMAALALGTSVHPGNALGLEASPYLAVFPSPSSGPATIDIRLPAGVAGGRLEISDVSGRVVWRSMIRSREAQLHWPSREPSRHAAGVYFVRVRADGMSRCARLVYLKGTD